MWLRVVIALLVLGLSPLSSWAASLCCGETEACCQGEIPSCPVLPDGKCALVATGGSRATLADAPELPAPQADPGTVLTANSTITLFVSPSFERSAVLLSRPLRN